MKRSADSFESVRVTNPHHRKLLDVIDLNDTTSYVMVKDMKSGDPEAMSHRQAEPGYHNESDAVEMQHQLLCNPKKKQRLLGGWIASDDESEGGADDYGHYRTKLMRNRQLIEKDTLMAGIENLDRSASAHDSSPIPRSSLSEGTSSPQNKSVRPALQSNSPAQDEQNRPDVGPILGLESSARRSGSAASGYDSVSAKHARPILTPRLGKWNGHDLANEEAWALALSDPEELGITPAVRKALSLAPRSFKDDEPLTAAQLVWVAEMTDKVKIRRGIPLNPTALKSRNAQNSKTAVRAPGFISTILENAKKAEILNKSRTKGVTKINQTSNSGHRNQSARFESSSDDLPLKEIAARSMKVKDVVKRATGNAQTPQKPKLKVPVAGSSSQNQQSSTDRPKTTQTLDIKLHSKKSIKGLEADTGLKQVPSSTARPIPSKRPLTAKEIKMMTSKTTMKTLAKTNLGPLIPGENAKATISGAVKHVGEKSVIRKAPNLGQMASKVVPSSLKLVADNGRSGKRAVTRPYGFKVRDYDTMIVKLREQGVSFAKIAERVTEKYPDQPKLCGRNVHYRYQKAKASITLAPSASAPAAQPKERERSHSERHASIISIPSSFSASCSSSTSLISPSSIIVNHLPKLKSVKPAQTDGKESQREEPETNANPLRSDVLYVKILMTCSFV